MSSFDIYWILKLDEIHNLLGFISFFLFMGAILLGCSAFSMWFDGDARKNVYRQCRKGSYISCILFVVFLSLCILIPTTKQACAIYVLPKIINNEKVQKIPEKILDLSNQWLDNHIDKETEGAE